jgi:hypothetical protein
MRYSNEFDFGACAALGLGETLAECGLAEAGVARADEWKRLICRHAGFFSFDPDTRNYCIITVSTPWRDTPAQPGNSSPHGCGINVGNCRRDPPHVQPTSAWHSPKFQTVGLRETNVDPQRILLPAICGVGTLILEK